MAVTRTIGVTKTSVSKISGKDDYSVAINLTITDVDDAPEVEDVVVLSREYSQPYNSNAVLSDIKASFLSSMQSDYDQVAAEQAIHDAQALDTMVTEIQSTVDSYINPGMEMLSSNASTSQPDKVSLWARITGKNRSA